jgi:predicted kinase
MKLIVFSGLPGTGKSTLAETLGKKLSIPVFAKDWLEAVLLQNDLKSSSKNKPLGYACYELLTVLARRQLMLGQSVILDSVASTHTIRNTWKELSQQYKAGWRVIECVCSDEYQHRSRLHVRERDIPGWHELTWPDVEMVKKYYQPWIENRLIADTINSIDEHISRVKSYCE